MTPIGKTVERCGVVLASIAALAVAGLAALGGLALAQAPGQGTGLQGPANITNCSTAPAHLCVHGDQPTMSAGCGTGASIAGSGIEGHVFLGIGTSQPCTLTFVTAYIERPDCVVSADSFTVSYTATTTALTFTTLIDRTRIYWHCFGHNAG